MAVILSINQNHIRHRAMHMYLLTTSITRDSGEQFFERNILKSLGFDGVYHEHYPWR
jgi:hypothetical protein